MIKDILDNAQNYYSLSKNLKVGFEWLKNHDLKNMADGKYVINDDIYANVQSYMTKDDAPFEAHKKYIDIQYMIDGEENIELANYMNCDIKVEYDKEKDIEFLECNRNVETQTLKQDYYLVFFPSDVHKPALKINEPRQVKKVIVKVAL